MKLPKIELYNSHDARNYFATTISNHGLLSLVIENKKYSLDLLGIEPGAFHMQSERATTALQARFNQIVPK